MAEPSGALQGHVVRLRSISSRITCGPGNEVEVGNPVLVRMSAMQGQTEARTRLLTLSRLRRYATSLDRTSYTETVTKNIIVNNFSMGKWSFSKTCGTKRIMKRK